MLSFILSKLIVLALHIENTNIFPPPLSTKEENLCLEAVALGDKKAKDRLIKHNLRLVAHIIKKYYSAESENEELISVGTVGLIKAINTFDNSKGVRLATYASRCIENEVLMYFRNQKKTSLDISLDEPIDTDSQGNTLTLNDIIYMDDTILEDLCEKNNVRLLIKFINEIKDNRERSIIIMRYGLDGNMPKTQNEIAEIYGISRSYVSRLETKILKNIRKRFEREG